MGKIITPVLPHDLPENWTDNQYVTPSGTEVGLTEQHGFNYLMKQVNNAQKAINELDNQAFPSSGGKLTDNITFDASDYNGPWARGLLLTEDTVFKAGFGGHGGAGTVERVYLGLGENPWDPETGILISPGSVTVRGTLYVDYFVINKVSDAVVG